MSKYGGVIGNLVSSLESSTMSKHLQGYENDEGIVSKKIQDEPEKEDLAKFSKYITHFENGVIFSNLDVNKNMSSLEFAEYLAKKLTNLNEYCLQDRAFSEAIVKDKEYAKEFFSKTGSDLSIEAIVASGYRKRTIHGTRYGVDGFEYKIDYLPSKTDDEPNIIRFYFNCMGYSAIFDICSDGELICRDASKPQVETYLDESGEIKFTRSQAKCELDDVFVGNQYFNPNALDNYRKFFMCVLEKAELLTMGIQK